MSTRPTIYLNNPNHLSEFMTPPKKQETPQKTEPAEGKSGAETENPEMAAEGDKE